MIVVPGCRAAVAAVTNRPVLALRLTVRVLLVPRPTRSVVVVRGDRTAVLLRTNRPVLALRATVREPPRAMMIISSGSAVSVGPLLPEAYVLVGRLPATLSAGFPAEIAVGGTRGRSSRPGDDGAGGRGGSAGAHGTGVGGAERGALDLGVDRGL
ncbi:hypothetical protein [Micromonospora sp. LA-10]|uniref:hypothetical protein n=1 Tax=Micromonospora sp. LA-10 TaxID=3446364 RepID=UPI003F6F931B